MRFNVLHLIADDLRTSIGAYGHTDAAKTPHLDRLAAQGVVFENAYSQIAVCTPPISAPAAPPPAEEGQWGEDEPVVID